MTTREELIRRLEGPLRIANGITLGVIAAAMLNWALSGQPIVLPSWMGWLGALLIISSVLQVINGILTIRLAQLERRAALLKAEG